MHYVRAYFALCFAMTLAGCFQVDPSSVVFTCSPAAGGNCPDGHRCSPTRGICVPAPFGDFPHEPLGGGSVDNPGALARAFSAGPQNASGGPCISEPTFGALYPRNFTPPLIEWIPGPGQDVFELRMHIENQMNDLVVYTSQPSFILPDDIWAGLSANSQDADMAIAIRGGQLAAGGSELAGGAFAGSSGTVHIAPVDADGAIVYWTTSSNTALKGFKIGDKRVSTVLSPELITAAGKPTRCIGCHTSSPDGMLAFFGSADPQFSVDARQVNGSGAPPLPSQVTANALRNLARVDQDLPTLSKAHYGPGDAVVITSLFHPATANKWELVYTDLLAQSGGTGVIARGGDPNGAATPAWSHDGNTIVYTSTAAIVQARLDMGNGDLWTVPYNNRAGGQAAPLPGANEPASNQYYPAYSAEDQFIAFNRNPRGHQMYNSAEGELWVVPAGGGAPTRLAANDPPACTGQRSPGLTNSWPRWSPSAPKAGGRRFYWLVFSSRRRPFGSPATNPPQLYLSAVVTKDGPGGEIIEGAYPAVYIPTQPAAESNHTPAWGEFRITID